MATAFAAALRRYIGTGYRPTEAMRAVWHDVRLGRVARPAPARRHRREPPKGTAPGALPNAAPLTTRAASRLVRTDPVVRRRPGVGYSVRLGDGRELCHDARGYYLSGRARTPGRNPKGSIHTVNRAPRIRRPARPAQRAIPGPLHYYAYAPREDGTIGQLLVERAGGRTVRAVWTGVTYRTLRAAAADVGRLNRQIAAARQRGADRPPAIIGTPRVYPPWMRRNTLERWMRWLPTRRQVEIREGPDGPVQKMPVSGDVPAVVFRHPFAWVRIDGPSHPARARPATNPRAVSAAAKLATLRRIVARRQSMRIGAEGSVDAFTASAILSVYDRLGSVNQARYLAMPVRRMADVAWTLVKGNPEIEVFTPGAVALAFDGRRVVLPPEAGRRNPRGRRRASRARYCAERLADPRRFDPRSFRTVVQAGHRVTVGCPRGEWDRRRRRCRVGTRAQRILHPAGEGRCPVGGRALGRPARNAPRARLTRFYDAITEVRGVKGRRFGYAPGTPFRHPFTTRPAARGVDRPGYAYLRRGQVVLGGRRPIYAQLGAGR